jgi:sugar lactone lactonase YvrE
MKQTLLVGIMLVAAIASGQELPIWTMAGNGASGSTNGFGSNARFNHPMAVAADAGGNIFVADAENELIRKITPGGLVSAFAGAAGVSGFTDGASNTARFYGPQGIAVAGDGSVYVADSANHLIRKLNAAGAATTLAGSAGAANSLDGAGGSARFFHPESVAVGPDANIYVADTLNHTIRKITPAGQVSTLSGLAGNAGSVDGTNNRPRFNRPGGIAVDGGTNIFVADTFNHTIREINAVGRVTTLAGMPGVWGSSDGTNSNARFFLPQGVAVLITGELLVSDAGNQTLRKVSPVGTNWVVTTVAGMGGLAGSATGTGVVARFTAPTALAVDVAGYAYIADTGNHIIRTTRIVQPTLQSVFFGGQLVLSWPTSAEGFSLQQSPTLGSSAVWSTIGTGTVLEDNYVRTNSAVGSSWFRLTHGP